MISDDRSSNVPTYIGIDGGGSTTRIFMQRGDAAPEYFEFPVSLKVGDGDFATSAQRLKEVLSAECSVLRTGGDSAISIAIGLSGMSRAENQDALKAAIRAIPELAAAKLHIESDATLTLKAAIPNGEPGILLIAGTGSVVYYQTEASSRDHAWPHAGGHLGRLGGWGPMLSDEGSGYRIGLRALRRYIGVLDGVYPRASAHAASAHAAGAHAALSAAIAQRLLPEEREDRQAITRRAASDPAFVASFARDVFDAASSPTMPALEGARGAWGQAWSRPLDLIHEELVDLFVIILSVIRSNALSGQKPYKLYLSGSIAKHPITQEAIRMSFEESDLTLVLVDDRAPCAKALEIARWMT